MKRSILTLAIQICLCPLLFAQTPLTWQTLPNAPVVGRHNDAYFVSADMGWIVNGDGDIFKTSNAGLTWDHQFHKAEAHFRAVGFADASRGWAGNVGNGEFGATDTTVIYQTTNGGLTWDPQHNFDGPTPAGICGLNVVNDSMVVGVGRVRGPAFFVKSTDGGETWTSKDMSAYAAGLIDVYFFTPDVGIAVGLTNANHEASSGVILATNDGGETWEVRFTTSRTGEWCWKISFPTDQVGYVSLQRNSQTPIYFLKTTDGGATWEEKIFYQSYYFVQGMGFINELEGWAGGNSSMPTLQTKDGGETWYSAGFGARVNRFRFLGDSLAYAVGRSVYKYAPETAVAVEKPAFIATNWPVLHTNYPNPFHKHTSIEYELPEPASVQLVIFDVTGRRIRVLVNHTLQTAGRHQVAWDGTDEQARAVSSGIYFYSLKTDNANASINTTKQMVVLE